MFVQLQYSPYIKTLPFPLLIYYLDPNVASLHLFNCSLPFLKVLDLSCFTETVSPFLYTDRNIPIGDQKNLLTSLAVPLYEGSPTFLSLWAYLKFCQSQGGAKPKGCHRRQSKLQNGSCSLLSPTQWKSLYCCGSFYHSNILKILHIPYLLLILSCHLLYQHLSMLMTVCCSEPEILGRAV